MNENLFVIVAIILSPLLVLAWINIFYLFLNRRKDTNQNISILSIVSLYLFSLVPIGFFVGYHLMNGKVKNLNEKGFKYSEGVRVNGNLILIVSIASTLLSILNLL